jgi:hypothetical protein
MEPHIASMKELLDVIEKDALADNRVTVEGIVEALGHRSFGPLLLLAGLITVTPPLGDIPGVPIIMGTLVLLSAVQLLLGRKHFWLPGWLLRRSIKREHLCKVLHWMRKPAQCVDHVTRHRLTILTHGAGVYLIALATIAIALLTPVMELIPFSANLAGIALFAFGLSLIAHDGLLALVALILTALMFGWLGAKFL